LPGSNEQFKPPERNLKSDQVTILGAVMQLLLPVCYPEESAPFGEPENRAIQAVFVINY